MAHWTELIEVNEEVLDKQEIQNLIDEMKNSDDDFVIEHGFMIERQLYQLANEEITEEEFRSYLQDSYDLILLSRYQLEVRNKALTQKIIEIVGKLIIKGSVSLMGKL